MFSFNLTFCNVEFTPSLLNSYLKITYIPRGCSSFRSDLLIAVCTVVSHWKEIRIQYIWVWGKEKANFFAYLFVPNSGSPYLAMNPCSHPLRCGDYHPHFTRQDTKAQRDKCHRACQGQEPRTKCWHRSFHIHVIPPHKEYRKFWKSFTREVHLWLRRSREDEFCVFNRLLGDISDFPKSSIPLKFGKKCPITVDCFVDKVSFPSVT